MSPLARSLWIALGGAAGCNVRYWLSNAIDQSKHGAFPLGIALVNISGSFVMGLAAGWLSKAHADSVWIPLITIGFLGGYTTFSTFSLDFVRLAEDGHWKEALGYFVVSTVVSVLACAAGWAMIQKLTPSS